MTAPGVLTNDAGTGLSAVKVTNPGHGTLTLQSNGAFTYTPAPNFFGSDSFTYQTTDGSAFSNIATVGLTVSPVNDAPVAGNNWYPVRESSPRVIAAPGVLSNDTDVDPGTTLTAVKISNPAHGMVSLNSNGGFTYIPNPGYVGPDSFTYKAFDGALFSNLATVSLTVYFNHPPVAFGNGYYTPKDTALFVAAPGVLGNDYDADGDPLHAVKFTNPAHGSLSLQANGGFTYVPATGFVGVDSFTYRAGDGLKWSNVAIVTITVQQPNRAPVALDNSYATPEDTAVFVAAPGVLGNDSDADHDTLTAVKVTDPGHGTLTLQSNGAFTYTPAASFVGTDTFTYKAFDGAVYSNVATVSITVHETNHAPVAFNDSYTAPRNTTRVIAAPGVLANDTDADHDVLKAVLVAGPTHGVLFLAETGGFSYAPTAGFIGTDSFRYQANDGEFDSNVATVTIEVKTPATLGISTSAGIITFGRGVTIHATLRHGDNPLRFRTVTLQRCTLVRAGDEFVCGSWRTIRVMMTNSFGRASFTAFPFANVRYRWLFAGGPALAPTSSRAATVFVRTAVIASSSAHVIRHHGMVTLFATVRPNHGGQHVTLQRFVRGIGWVNRASLHLNGVNAFTSRAAITLHLVRTGTYMFRFVKTADANHARGVSSTLFIHVI